MLLPEKIVLQRFPEFNYAIVWFPENKYSPFVAVWHLNEDDPDNIYWSQGHYFGSLIDCAKFVEQKEYEYRLAMSLMEGE